MTCRWLSFSVSILAPVIGASAMIVARGQNPQAAGRPDDWDSLRHKINDLVRQELTRHWYPHAVNRERGGFHQSMARDWSLERDENAFLVYQSRMAWTAAAFARYSPAHRDEFIQYARHGIAFIDQVMRDKERGGFHWVVDAQGRLDPRLGDEKHVYGTAFAMYAASVVRAVTGDELALKLAKDAFDWLEQHAHDSRHGGYFEAIARDGAPILSWKAEAPVARRTDRLGVYYGFKSMNSHIHLLEALTEFTRIDDRPIVRERLRETYQIVRDRIAVEPGALNLYLTRDWRAIPGHDSFGHDVETAYLLIEAAEALGLAADPDTWRMPRLLVDHALDWGWDAQYGGFYDKGESFNGQAFDRKKVWWTQAEGLNALLIMHLKFKESTDRFGKAFWKQWSFIENHMIDPLHGGWYAETTRDGKLIGDGAKASQWKANYHTARALMNVSRMLASINDPSRENGHAKNP